MLKKLLLAALLIPDSIESKTALGKVSDFIERHLIDE
jgi:hypothetical protein